MCSGGEYEEATDHMSLNAVAGNASGGVGIAISMICPCLVWLVELPRAD